MHISTIKQRTENGHGWTERLGFCKVSAKRHLLWTPKILLPTGHNIILKNVLLKWPFEDLDIQLNGTGITLQEAFEQSLLHRCDVAISKFDGLSLDDPTSSNLITWRTLFLRFYSEDDAMRFKLVV